MPCPTSPSNEALIPVNVEGNTCPSACTPNPVERCFYDPACKHNAVGTLGCGAGSYESCRFCGFDSYPSCPDVDLEEKTMVDTVKRAIRPQLPQEARNSTLLQVDLTFETDFSVAFDSTECIGTCAEENELLIEAFRAFACGSPADGAPAEAQPGHCQAHLLAQASSNALTSTSRARRQMQEESEQQLTVRTSTTSPLHPTLAALLHNSSNFDFVLAQLLHRKEVSTNVSRTAPTGLASASLQSYKSSRRFLVRMLRLFDDEYSSDGAQSLAGVVAGAVAQALALPVSDVTVDASLVVIASFDANRVAISTPATPANSNWVAPLLVAVCMGLFLAAAIRTRQRWQGRMQDTLLRSWPIRKSHYASSARGSELDGSSNVAVTVMMVSPADKGSAGRTFGSQI